MSRSVNGYNSHTFKAPKLSKLFKAPFYINTFWVHVCFRSITHTHIYRIFCSQAGTFTWLLNYIIPSLCDSCYKSQSKVRESDGWWAEPAHSRSLQRLKPFLKIKDSLLRPQSYFEKVLCMRSVLKIHVL